MYTAAALLGSTSLHSVRNSAHDIANQGSRRQGGDTSDSATTAPTRSWLSGYFGSGDAATRAAWTAAYSAPQVWTTFVDYETSWAARARDIRSRQSQYSRPVADGSGINVLTIGLVLSGQNGSQVMNPAALKAAASGADITGWSVVGQAIAAAGLDSASTVLRIGHEPNGNWYPWSTRSDPTLMGYYRRAWRYAQRAVRAVCPNVRFDLCLNVSLGGSAAITGHYPGDAYIDIIGLDFYDYATSTTGTQFHSAQGSCGVNNIAAFAHLHGKKAALDEWGVSTTAAVAVRDNPFYIQSMYAALTAAQTQYPSVISHDSYFNASNNHNLSVNPKAAAAYHSLWTEPVAASTPSPSPSPAPTPTPTAGPGSVTGLTVSAPDNTSITVSWTGSTGNPDAYSVFLNHRYTATVKAGARSYTYTGLTASTGYNLSVSGSRAGVHGPQNTIYHRTSSSTH